ncbi:MAG: type 4a pilus biogenesis protein PilO [candidate division FCPU426 bacterium]
MKREWWLYLGIGAAVVAVLVLYLLFAYLPLSRRLAEHRRLLTGQEQAWKQAQEMVARFPELSAEVETARLQFEKLDRRLPAQPRIPELLKDVTRIAAECNLSNLQFTPQPLAPNPEDARYSVQAVRLTISGNYHDIGRFVSRLAELQRLAVARELQLTGRDQTGGTGSVSAEMTLVTYVRSQP